MARHLSSRRLVCESDLPCLLALARLACELDEASLTWGVTGSVGFTLASGLDVLRADSDLDLLVHAPDEGDAESLRALRRSISDTESRVDVQVETPCGAFALKEWLRTGGPVLLKTADGPLLCDDPWHAGGLNAMRPGPVTA
jgi:phosphoribosyl-dephospho-CoA transferase